MAHGESPNICCIGRGPYEEDKKKRGQELYL